MNISVLPNKNKYQTSFSICFKTEKAKQIRAAYVTNPHKTKK